MDGTTRQPTHEFTLKNGLKVIVREDHRAPVVVSQLWYKVGASYEPPGKSGISHALEHMMFRGSKRLGPGEASLILRELGAEENAFTTEDCTTYHQTLARDRLSIALELEADRLNSLRLLPEEFEREIEVVKNERNLSTEDDPRTWLDERFKTLAYQCGGYSTPVVGWRADLDRLTIADLREWYEQWYGPNNATLVVVGDVTRQEVQDLAQRHFGPIPKRHISTAKIPLGLKQPGERLMTLRGVHNHRLQMAFNVPSRATAQSPLTTHCLQLMAALLGRDHNSRIATRLTNDGQRITNASCTYEPFCRGDTLFSLSATPNNQNEVSLDNAQAAIWELLDEFKHTPVPEQELNLIRTQIFAEQVYARDSINTQATLIGTLETIGLPWTLMDSLVSDLQKVTSADLQHTAKTWFTRDRLSVVHALPEVDSHE